ncbi:MAG: hypothetical protein VB138_12295 [Burkholderia sp.]
MNADNNTHVSLARSLRIVAYCALAAIVIALFVAMCAILRESALDREATQRGTTDTLELHDGTGSSPDVAPDTAVSKSPG